MARDPWDANIETAYESITQNLSEEGYDGNRTYDGGTYGQSDYTVRERADGTSDVYVSSSSEKLHAHYRIDSEGNILDKYHDFIMMNLNSLYFEQMLYVSEEECLETATEILQQSSGAKTLTKRMF